MYGISALNSQPVPGWAKSNINNSNSQSKDIDLGINNSENKNKQQDSGFNNSVSSSSNSAEGQNQNTENENNPAQNKLSESEKRKLQKLKRRDREVRAHEMAHQSAGGQYAGSASYNYTTGPDNKRYAVGGSVDIDTGAEESPEKTIEKANQIKRAAMAPAQPSTADLKIAAKAARMKMQAQAELRQKESNINDKSKNSLEKNNSSSEEINDKNEPQFNNKYIINKRENSYQNSMNEININNGIAA